MKLIWSKPSSQGTLSHFTAQGIGELDPTKAKDALVRFARRPVIDYYHCVAAHGMTPGTKGITVGHVAPEVADQLLGHIQGAQRTPEVTHEFCNVAWRIHDLTSCLQVFMQSAIASVSKRSDEGRPDFARYMFLLFKQVCKRVSTLSATQTPVGKSSEKNHFWA